MTQANLCYGLCVLYYAYADVDQVWMIGHNVFACDVNVLYASCKKHGLDFSELTLEAKISGWVDTYQLAPIMIEFAEMPQRRLGDLFQKCTGNVLNGAHDAGEDAKALLTIWRHKYFQERLKNKTLPLGRLHQAQLAHSEQLYLRDCEKRDKVVVFEEREMKAWEECGNEWSDEDEESDPEESAKW